MSEDGRTRGRVPWLMVSFVAGIVIVVAIALLSFSGYIPVVDIESSGIPTPAITVTQTPRQITPPVTPLVSVTVRIQTPVVTASPTIVVPPAGVYIRVDYIGSFNGTYGTNGEQQHVRQSGIRWYPLSSTEGTVAATFQKEDGTTKNALSVEIYKDGKLLQSGNTSAAFGKVQISANV